MSDTQPIKQKKWLLGFYRGVPNPPPIDQDFTDITGPESPLWEWADISTLESTTNFDGLPYPVFDETNPAHNALVKGFLWAIVFEYPPEKKPAKLAGGGGSEFVGKDG